MGDINKQHGNNGWALNWLIDTAYDATPTLFNNMECNNRVLMGTLEMHASGLRARVVIRAVGSLATHERAYDRYHRNLRVSS